jgi:hypothetical protein
MRQCEVHSDVPAVRRHVGYCEVCSRNLCDECLAEGCCGNIPALDGEREDATHDP